MSEQVNPDDPTVFGDDDPDDAVDDEADSEEDDGK
jgi:hypothetical protein